MAQATVFLARKRRPALRKPLQCFCAAASRAATPGCCAEQSPRIGHSSTSRVSRDADQGPEVHQRRIVQAATLFWQKPARDVSQKRTAGRVIHRFPPIPQAGEDPRDIRVDHRLRRIERKRRDGRCGVFTHSWQTAQRLHRTRDLPFPSLHHRFGGPVEIPRAAVVSQPLPEREHILFRSPGPEPRGSGILPSNAENRESPPSPSSAAA